MNILIITTFFPPDSTIASVRPYMFAKHLAATGENVTVIRSGYFEMPPYDDYTEAADFEVLSALGRDCDAEKYKRGEYDGFKVTPQRKLRSLPRRVRLPIKAVRDFGVLLCGKKPRCQRLPAKMLSCQKRLIDRLYSKNRRYDVVFSTCGECVNIYAGKYAAEKFGAKWIMDFRDSMIVTEGMNDDFWWNVYTKKATIAALKQADCITAVSKGLADELNKTYPSDKIKVIYNGFDDSADMPALETDKGSLSFCYTGRLHLRQRPVLRDMVRCLADLINKDIVDRRKIHFNYAGSSSADVKKVFAKEGIPDVFTDCGYVSKQEAANIQMSSDVFTLFSWNTKKSKGILTGKFYEGVRARKTILALISGNEPNSELFEFRKKYEYGFCYERCRGKSAMKKLEAYIEKLYLEKISVGVLSYKPSQELYDDFSYSLISQKLRSIMQELCEI